MQYHIKIGTNDIIMINKEEILGLSIRCEKNKIFN